MKRAAAPAVAPRLIVCRLADGTTTREAALALVRGRALLGPTSFPVWRPRTVPGESAQLTANRGWVIRKRGTRARSPG